MARHQHPHRPHTSPRHRPEPAGDTRRTLSQNFLHDPRTIERVARAARLGPDDLVVEVGAGDGRLTRALARRCRQVIAYELDGHLAARLRANARRDPGIKAVHGDFLVAPAPGEPFVVVGNIPYAVTARIVDWCLNAPGLRAATLVTQREYARKRTGDYGRWSRLTVRTWPWFDWRLLARIDRDEFRPVPRVDSAVLRLERRSVPSVAEHLRTEYVRFVDLGFTGVGGCLGATLRQRYRARPLGRAFRSAGVDPRTVMALVPPDRWVGLFLALHEPERGPR